jgi:hypothetical protein
MPLGCGVLFFLGHETVNDLMMMLLMVSSSNCVIKCVMEPDIFIFPPTKGLFPLGCRDHKLHTRAYENYEVTLSTTT